MTLNSCTAGALSDTVDSSTQYLWSCTGSNGGTTASCSLAKPPSPDTTAPIITLTAPPAGQVSGSVTISANAADPTSPAGQITSGLVGVQFKLDGVNLGQELTTAPYSGSWNTLAVANGSHTLTATARDAAGNTAASGPVLVTVANPINLPPALSSIGPKSVSENSLLTITLAATDPNGDNLTYSSSNLPASAAFNPVSRIFSWTPSYTQSGSYTVTFTVSDGQGGTDSETIALTVSNTNRAPQVNAGNDQTITLPGAATLSGSASDPDGQSLVYAWSRVSGPGTVTFVAPGSAVTAVSFPASGDYTIRLSVSDGSITSTDDLVITVNSAPVIITDTDQDGVPDSLDKCPGTSLSLKSRVNTRGCPRPKMTNFSLQTDLTSVDLNAVSSFELGNSYGQIAFSESSGPYTLVASGGQAELDIDSGVTISASTISLDGSRLPELNRQARLTFHNISFESPAILRDGALCLACSQISYSNGSYVVSVPSFSTYTIINQPPADTTPPTVSITSPLNNSSVTSGSLTISATAQDNQQVSGVSFWVDNAIISQEITSSPYQVTWSATIGNHTLSAVARDSSDNYATSTISLTVSDPAPSTGGGASPASGSPAGGGSSAGPSVNLGTFTPTVEQIPLATFTP
ncbi:MAG TPA: Ig-like domain-containing protein, partial [Candidatus Glassbacteria bacterium]|nr:Ig-like domain-containing protein [Candidatus Glassbacteria bacterium]